MKRMVLFLCLSVSNFAFGMNERPMTTDLNSTIVDVAVQEPLKETNTTKSTSTDKVTAIGVVPRSQSTNSILCLIQNIEREKAAPNLDTKSQGGSENEFSDISLYKADWQDMVVVINQTKVFANNLKQYVGRNFRYDLLRGLGNPIWTFFIMRHAKDADIDKVHCQECSDCNITVTDEAKSAFQILTAEDISVYTPDEERNKQTALTIFNKAAITVNNSFKELAFPQLKGMKKSKAGLNGLVIKMFQDVCYKGNPDNPEAESVHNVAQRFFDGLLTLCHENSSASKHVIVSNFATMNAILRFFCHDMRTPLAIPYLSGFVLTVFPAFNMISIYTENDEPVLFDTTEHSIRKVKALLDSPETKISTNRPQTACHFQRPASPGCNFPRMNVFTQLETSPISTVTERDRMKVRERAEK